MKPMVVVAMVFSAFGPLIPQKTVEPTNLVGRLAGLWKAAEDRTPRVTDLDVQLFGPGAYDARNVTLTIRPTGQGTLRVSTVVVGRKGHRYAPTVLEAELTIGDPINKVFGRLVPTVTVDAAEVRYLDGTHDRFVKKGTRASISVSEEAATELEFRFDTQEGRDSFGTRLMRTH